MIFPFRENKPFRRPNRKLCKNYTSYKKTLREDFYRRCGYCNDYDKYKIASFTIDHFVPRNPSYFEHNIAPNYYYNLVWSCAYCNASKSNKWPTKNAEIHNNGSIGFVDPVDDKFNDLFFRNEKGNIVAREDSLIASYIKEELKLWLPIHSLMWRLEKLKNNEAQLKEKLLEVKDIETQNEINLIGAAISSLLDEIYEHND